MSGETEEQQSGWSTDTLKAHVDEIFRLLRQQMERQWAEERRTTDHNLEQQQHATKIALDAHDEALRVARDTAQREVAVARDTSEKAITAALAAQKEAVTVAQGNAEQRADIIRQFADQRAASTNEWRRTLDDYVRGTMPRTEAEAAIARATERIHELTVTQVSLITRAEHEAVINRMTERIAELNDRIKVAEAMQAGKKQNQAGIYAALGAAVALIAIISFIANALFR